MVLEDLRRQRAAVQSAIDVLESIRPVCLVNVSKSPTLNKMVTDNWRLFNAWEPRP
jgi:hypothetical protein